MLKISYKTKGTIFIVILFFMSAISGVASDIHIAAFPEIASYFNVPADAIKWTVSLYFVGLGISQLIYGPISDYIGRKKIMIFGCIVFGIGCLLCMCSKGFLLFLLSRFVQGCGAGATACISRAIMRDTHEGAALAKILSYIGIGLAVIPAIAPVVGGYIQYLGGWKLEFLFMLLYTMALLFLASYTIPETNSYKLQNKKSIKEIIVDYHTTLIDPIFLINVLVASIIISMIYIFYTITSFYLQNNLHWSAVEYSRISIVVAVSLFIGRKLNVMLSKSLPANTIILVGCTLSLLASIIMFIFNLAKLHIVIILFIPIAIYAIAGGMIFSNTFIAATRKCTQKVGSVSSLYGVTQMLTIFAMISLSTLLEISTIKGIYRLLFLSSTIAVILILFLIKKYDRT